MTWKEPVDAVQVSRIPKTPKSTHHRIEIQIKSCLKGAHFASIKEVQTNKEREYSEGHSKKLAADLLPEMAVPDSKVCEC
ncbi:hypothetical protein TNCV_1210211 [Trichonephila clavipes]|nr:hypothetical protein TNCV_1210211 [Trichonephila clavipes]